GGRHTRSKRDWSSDVCSSDLGEESAVGPLPQIRSVEPGRCAQPRPLLRLSLRFLGALAGSRDSRVPRGSRDPGGLEGKKPACPCAGGSRAPHSAHEAPPAAHAPPPQAVARSRLRNPIAASPTSTAAAARNTSVAGADRSSAGYCPICV